MLYESNQRNEEQFDCRHGERDIFPSLPALQILTLTQGCLAICEIFPQLWSTKYSVASSAMFPTIIRVCMEREKTIYNGGDQLRKIDQEQLQKLQTNLKVCNAQSWRCVTSKQSTITEK